MGRIGDKFRRRFSEATLTAGALLASAPLLAVSKKNKDDNGDGANDKGDKNDSDPKPDKNDNQRAAANNDEKNGDGKTNNDRADGDNNRDDSGNQNDRVDEPQRADRRQDRADDTEDDTSDDRPNDADSQPRDADDTSDGGNNDGSDRQDFTDLTQQADSTPTPTPTTNTPLVSPVDSNGLATIENPDGDVVVGFDDDTGRLVAISGDVEASVGPGGPLVIIPDREIVVPVTDDQSGTDVINGSDPIDDGGDTTGGDNDTDFNS